MWRRIGLMGGILAAALATGMRGAFDMPLLPIAEPGPYYRPYPRHDARPNRYTPHQGEREKARRRRQMERSVR